MGDHEVNSHENDFLTHTFMEHFGIFASKTMAEDLFLFCLLSLLDNSLKFLAEKDHLFLYRKHYRCLPLREMMGQS